MDWDSHKNFLTEGPVSDILPQSKIHRYKRPFDLAVLAVVSAVGLPLWILLAIVVPICIWLDDRGPIFFRQERVGQFGRKFSFLKFRSMVPNAERTSLWTRDRDPRVTRVGRIIRRTAIDEVPQMINILRGEMSWVGPRALPTKMHEMAVEEQPRFVERLVALPGAVGVAQMYLPRHTLSVRRLRYDLVYIRNASIWLDLRLMSWAAVYILSGKWGRGRLRTDQGLEAQLVEES